jgi:copper homeostasis protein
MNTTPKTLEICCFSFQSCKNAEIAGANRIELCGGLLEGGTTPSNGLVKMVLNHVSIPVYIMIRPRGGDFLYSKSEIEVMINDINELKKLKPAGFVFGLLNKNGDIDVPNCELLLNAAGNTHVTFHRAFDMCSNPSMAIGQLIDLGFENILTSGQKNYAHQGIENLKTYVSIANNKIKIMAGSGVKPQNIQEINEAGVHAFHFSAKATLESQMVYRNPNVKMGSEHENEYALYEADSQLIREAVKVIEKL